MLDKGKAAPVGQEELEPSLLTSQKHLLPLASCVQVTLHNSEFLGLQEPGPPPNVDI